LLDNRDFRKSRLPDNQLFENQGYRLIPLVPLENSGMQKRQEQRDTKSTELVNKNGSNKQDGWVEGKQAFAPNVSSTAKSGYCGLGV
jgi:hypothetical protein